MLNFTFPLYKLRLHLAYKEEDNISYVKNTMGIWQILDNKNLTGDSLASRRLKISDNKYNLTSAILTFSQLLKQHNAGDRYIDTTGFCFTYRKTIFVPLKYHKIVDTSYVNGLGIILRVHNISTPIVIPAGYQTEGYVGLLEYAGGYLLYDMPTSARKKDTKRKI